MRAASAVRRAWAFATGMALVLVSVVAVTASGAAADPPPLGPTSDPTVTTDPLPTVQIDGVAWDQVIVGHTVYVAGDFTTARPAGAAAGTQTTARSNLLAYDIDTGNLVTTWAPSVDGPAYAIAASPDGTRIYVGGDFAHANGASRNRFAAFAATTGALSSTFTAGANAAVQSIQASATAVYIGGNFDTVGGQDRPRVASFDASTGAVRNWRASVQPAQVDALLLSPDGSTLYIGGRFQRINNVARLGTGAVSTSNAALLPWTLGPGVFAYGYSAGIQSLSTDGSVIYGTGFGFLTNNDGSDANLEGTFAADPQTAAVKWLEDCHGDTYSLFPNPGKNTVYVAGHPHNCGNFGGFPEVNPRVQYYGLAFGKDVVGQVQVNTQADYYDMEGYPSPELRGWVPLFTTGTYTGLNQAGFSVVGTSNYVVYGGEFTAVNGVSQQGLVRFTTRVNGAPGAMGPVLSGSTLAPTAASRAGGTMSIAWPTNWDRDDEFLTYRVQRDGTTVGTVTAYSRFWDRTRLSFTDTGLQNGRSYTYRVQAVDADGNAVTSPTVTASTGSSGALSAYASTVLADNPTDFWRLSGTSGNMTDWTSWSDAAVGGGVTRNVAGAIAADSDSAASFDGSSTARVSSTRQVAATSRLSEEAWFRTTSTTGGKLLGFGSSNGTANSSSYDRHIYMTADGHLIFGVYPGAPKTITSPGTYNDGRWHAVIATLGRNGMKLYVDGQQVAADPTVTFGQIFNGYWRIGGDNLGAWPNAGAAGFSGQIDDVAVYGRELSPADVARHYGIGATGQASNLPPTASFVATGGELTASVDGSASFDPDGTVVSWTWSWNDGSPDTTGPNPTATHAYAAGSHDITLTVRDDKGATATAVSTVQVVAPNAPPVAAFTSSVLGSTVSFDGGASNDGDGAIASYSWTFGDGAAGTGAQTAHTYAQPGTYHVTLVVVDDDGAQGTVTHDVVVTPPPPDATIARDAFGRTVASGWGTADAGGAWVTTANASRVDGSAGVLTLAAKSATASARLPDVTNLQASVAVSITADKRPSGSGAWTLVRARITPDGEYRLKLAWSAAGGLAASVVRSNAAGAETVVVPSTAVSGSYTAGSVVKVRFEASGASPTTLRGKVWTGATEPSAWLVQGADTTAGLQVAGHTGVAAIASSSAANVPVAYRFDDYVVTGPAPTNPGDPGGPGDPGNPGDPGDPGTPPGPQPQAGTPKNVIELIGDGMGFNTVDLGSLFRSGSQAYQATIVNGVATPVAGRSESEVYQAFPVDAAMSTYPAGRGYNPPQAWSSFTQQLAFPTDSAASGTALATGVKTNNAVLGLDVTGTPVRTVAEQAAAIGKATGVVTSVPWTDATPASLLTHVSDRDDHASIADQILASQATVVMGTGHPFYDDDAQSVATGNYDWVPQSAWDRIAGGQTPFTLVDTEAGFQALESGPTPARVIGVPHAHESLQAFRSDLQPDSTPFGPAQNTGVPTLSDMAKGAINVLDDDPDGFFLMVEGGAIDDSAHAHRTAAVVEEQVEFDKAVEAVVAWVTANSSWDDTLVLVTADHETGYIWGPGSNPTFQPVTGSAGVLPQVTWNTDSHSNELVPFYARGAGSAQLLAKATRSDPVRGAYLDNADVGSVLLGVWGGVAGQAPPGTGPVEPQPLAADSFDRTVGSGFGSADVGGEWTTSAGTSVDGSAAVVPAATGGAAPGARLAGVTGTALSVSTVAIPAKRSTGASTWLLLRGRIVDGQGEYRLKVTLTTSGQVLARVVRAAANGAETVVAPDVSVPGLTYSAGTRIGLRIEVSGTSPTSIRARVWNATSGEPSNWLLQAVDSTAGLQAAGHTGLAIVTSSGSTGLPAVVRFDDYRVDSVL